MIELAITIYDAGYSEVFEWLDEHCSGWDFTTAWGWSGPEAHQRLREHCVTLKRLADPARVCVRLTPTQAMLTKLTWDTDSDVSV